MKTNDPLRTSRNRRCPIRFYHHILLFLAGAVLLLAVNSAPAVIQLVEPYQEDYELTDLGPIEGVPMPFGGLTFKLGDPNTLLIGGNANQSGGALYAVPLQRDENNRITGFAGAGQSVISAPFNDGGVTYGPGNVLFLARYPENRLGLVRSGSAETDKIIDLNAHGILSSPGGLIFVPGGFPGAGKLMLASWPSGRFYSMNVVPDGTGLFNLSNVTQETILPGGPEGFIYVPPGSPQFTDYGSMLVSAYSHGTVDAYDIDERGVPIVATRRTFVSGLVGAEGAAVDPLTGDFLFSTWGAGVDRVIVVSGFTPPPTADVALTMGVNLEKVFTWQKLNLSLNLSNAGPETATGLLVTHFLPPGATRLETTPSFGETQVFDDVVIWSVPTLAAGAEEELRMEFYSRSAGELRHEAVVTLNEVDPDISNNSAFVYTTIELLRLAMSPNREGDELIFRWPILRDQDGELENWILESTSGLNPPVVWEPVDIPLVEEEGVWRTAVPLPEGEGWFFRLRKIE